MIQTQTILGEKVVLTRKIAPSTWMELKFYLPPNVYPLIDRCIEFEKFIRRLDKIVWINSKDFGQIKRLIYRIVTGYLGLIRSVIKDKSVNEVKKDIQSTLTEFYDKDGFPKDMSDLFEGEPNRIKAKINSMISNFQSFIESRIYDSIVQAAIETQKKFYEEFASISCDRAGVIPDFKTGKKLGEEIDFEDKKPKEKKEKK